MHQGCVRSRQRREGSGGVVADIAKLSVGREASYPRELATDHQQYLSGHGAGAATLGMPGEASPAGFQAMFEGRDPTTGELLGRPMAAAPSRPLKWSCGRPGASRSCTAFGDAAPGRAVLAAHHAGLAERWPTWTDPPGARRGHGGHEQVAGQGVVAVGFDHRTSREGDPLVPPSGHRQPHSGPEGRWTAVDGGGRLPASVGRGRLYRATYQRCRSRPTRPPWSCPTQAWPWCPRRRPRCPGPLGQDRCGRCARRGGQAPAKHASCPPGGAGARTGHRPGRQGRIRFRAAA
jgi:hypothetical protein